MSNYKLPKPPGDYRIGKYTNGECLYLITTYAYDTWYKQRVSVKHLCIKNNDGLALVDYPLKGDAKYSAFRITDCPSDYKKQIAKEVPEIYNQLWPATESKVEFKSEPTPDEYYVGFRGETHTYYVLPRAFMNQENSDNNIGWEANNRGSRQSPKYYRLPLANYKSWYKKFPQLSSEVKAELQKQNPVRYREWEQFYMKKYPNFKPLREQDALKPELPGINPGNMYIVYYRCNSDVLYIVDRDEYNTSDSTKAIVISSTHSLQQALAKTGNISKKSEAANNSKCFNFSTLPDNLRELFKRLRPEIYKQFEQYYTTQKQTKVAEKQQPAIVPLTFNPDSLLFISTGADNQPIGWKNSINWAIIDKAYFNSLDLEDMYISAMWADPLQLTRPRRKKECASVHSFEKALILYPPIIKANQQLYDRVISSKGSDFDIDEKAMKADYQDTLNKIDLDRAAQKDWSLWTEPKIGKVMVFGTGTGDSKNSEALKEMFYNPSSYSVGFDFYKPTGESERAFGIYSKGRRVGQSWANKAMKEFEQSWHQKIANLARQSDPPTAMGRALQANQQNNSNLKQQNNETIIVCRKVKPIIRCQTIRGTATQSNRIKSAITVGHSIDKSPIICGQKGTGKRKICVSTT